MRKGDAEAKLDETFSMRINHKMKKHYDDLNSTDRDELKQKLRKAMAQYLHEKSFDLSEWTVEGEE